MSDGVSHETHCGTNHIAEGIEAQIAARRAGKRKHVRHGGTLCCHCLERPPISKSDRMCHECRKADRKARRQAAKLELKRLRALEEQQKLSKGNHDEQ
jgi:hypothetical protein